MFTAFSESEKSNVMAAKYDKNAPSPDLFIQRKKLDLDSKALGRIFGSAESAPVYVAGALVVFLIISGISMLFIPAKNTSMSCENYWKTIAPIITLMMGYLFGKGSKK
jgi:hypothetical protein